MGINSVIGTEAREFAKLEIFKDIFMKDDVRDRYKELTFCPIT